MSRHKHKLRFIGIFLSVILSVSSVPLYAFASGTYDTGGAAAEEVTVSCEYVAKRGEFEKHYLLSDGSLVAVNGILRRDLGSIGEQSGVADRT